MKEGDSRDRDGCHETTEFRSGEIYVTASVLCV